MDFEAGSFDRGLGDLVMRVVGRGDSDEIDPFALGQLEFGFEHFTIRAVGTPLRDVVIGGRGLGFLSIGRQGPGDQRGPVVEHGGRGVDPSDERSLSAANQSHA